MTIQFDETIRAVLFRSGDECDWMAGINEQADGTITVRYRMRYDHPDTNPDEANSDKDKRSWYSMRLKPRDGKSLADVIVAIQKISDALGANGFTPPGGVATKLERGSMTVEQFVDAYLALPFARVRRVKLPGGAEFDVHGATGEVTRKKRVGER